MSEWKKERDERKAQVDKSSSSNKTLDLQMIAADLVRAEDEGLRTRGEAISLHDESADLEIHRKYEEERKKKELRRKRFQTGANEGAQHTAW